MKGSDKWGQGSGPRIEIVLAALVAVSLVGVYFFYLEGSGLNSPTRAGEVTTVSTTGVACDSDSLPQLAQSVEQDPTFASLSDGLCYHYLGDSSGVLTFAYYDGTISYPCGDAPLQAPASEILVNVTSAHKVASARLLAQSEVAVRGESCGPPAPVDVVSLQDVESTIPAVPQLNLTLAVPGGGHPVASLKAVLTLNGGSQVFKFGTVTSGEPLSPSMSASSTEIVLSNLTFKASEVYPMIVSGTLDSGQAFSFLVHVQVAQIP